jgi:hypothetical protein
MFIQLRYDCSMVLKRTPFVIFLYLDGDPWCQWLLLGDPLRITDSANIAAPERREISVTRPTFVRPKRMGA